MKSKKQELHGYLGAIAKACKLSGENVKREAELIEEVMRCDRPTLDALTSTDFNRLARTSQKALADHELRTLIEQMCPEV